MREPAPKSILERLSTLRKPGAAELTCVAVGLVCLLLPLWWSLNDSRTRRHQEVEVLLRGAAESSLARAASWAQDGAAMAYAATLRTGTLGLAASIVENAEQPGGEPSPPSAEPASRDIAAAVAALDDQIPKLGITAFALLSSDGRVLASSEVGLPAGARWTAELSPLVAPTAGLWAVDPSVDGWLPAAHLPLRSGGRLLLRLDGSQALTAILGAQPLGALYAAVDGRWAGLDGSPDSRGCEVEPAALLRRASGDSQAVRSALSRDLVRVNLLGYEGCSGGPVVGAWRTDDALGLTLIAELPRSEAFQVVRGLTLTVVAGGGLVAVLLLLLVWNQTTRSQVEGVERARSRKNSAAWGILAVSLLATAVAWYSTKMRFDAYEAARFESAASDLRKELLDRLKHHALAVEASVGAHQALGLGLTRRWVEFAETIESQNAYPSLECLLLVSRQGSAALPGEPFSRTRVVGVAQATSGGCPKEFSDLLRNEALTELAVRAKTAGELAVGALRLDSRSSAPGVVLVRPLLRASPEADHLVLDGWIVGQLDGRGLLGGLGEGSAETLNYELYSADAESDPTLVFDSDGVAPGPRADSSSTLRLPFDFGGARWVLAATRAHPFAPPIAQNYPAQVLLAGLAISVLLFDIALVLSSTRARALSIAELMTKRFRDGETRTRAVIDSAPDGIVTFDTQGVIHTFNPSAEQLFGYPRGEVQELRIQQLLPVCTPGQAPRLATAAPGAGRECEGVRKGGHCFPAELTVSRMQLDDRVLYAAIVRDVSLRKQTEEKLRDSEERYALASRGANDGLWDWNLKTNEVYYSARWKQIIGAESDQTDPRPDEWFDRVHPEDISGLRATLDAHLEGETEFFESEHRIRHSRGGYRWVLSRGLAVRDSAGVATRIAGSQTDVTKRKRVEKQLLYDALHDPLTGLPNRAYFMAQLESARAEAVERPGTLFGLLFLDVDRFKVVNDSMGHFIGDQLLVAIAERLHACVRPQDTICRLGGDEFAVLVESLGSVADATQIAERIQKTLRRPLLAGGQEVFAAVSIGIALSSSGRRSPEELLRDADIAMYRAKANGNGSCELFSERMHTRAVELMQIETDLRRAVERREMVVYYQPIYDLAKERVVGCEALLRWQHPKRGLLMPRQFITVAEETGMINEISEWLLDVTCGQAVAWSAAGLADVRMSVNISPRQLVQQDLAALVNSALQTHGLAPQRLQLELTESALMESSASTRKPLDDLAEQGVQISLDDFGTGYSSLIYLRRFPIHTLKIDQSFVQRAPTDDDDSAIVSGLITLAHSLNLGVIAEGVETPEQLNFLLNNDCDSIQGYVLSPAVPADEFARILEEPIGIEDLLSAKFFAVDAPA